MRSGPRVVKPAIFQVDAHANGRQAPTKTDAKRARRGGEAGRELAAPFTVQDCESSTLVIAVPQVPSVCALVTEDAVQGG